MVKIYLSKCIFLSETGDCLDGAIVTDGGNIAFVGDRQEALQEFPEGKVIDLGNRTVTAGLIETHSHIYAGGNFSAYKGDCSYIRLLQAQILDTLQFSCSQSPAYIQMMIRPKRKM